MIKENLKVKFKAGFTFVELLVVLAILLILVSIAIPAFRSFQRNSNLEAVAEEIVNALRLAQSKTLASESAEQFGIYFDTSTLPNQYTLFGGGSYALRKVSLDEIHSIPSSMEIYDLNLWGGKEVVFEKITGHVPEATSYGEISLRFQNDSKNIYIENSGLVSLDEPLPISDAGRVIDSRHVHFNYNREISTSTEKIILDFSTVSLEIPFNGNMQGGQFYWEGTVNVDGQDQVLKIHTHWFNSPDTEFCVHRDRRYNDEPLAISLIDDSSGNLAQYSAGGEVTRGSSVYLTIGSPGNPRAQ